MADLWTHLFKRLLRVAEAPPSCCMLVQGKTPPTPGGFRPSSPVLAIVLGGHLRAYLPWHGTDRTCELTSGQCFFSPAGCWLRFAQDTRRQMALFSFHPGQIQVSVQNRQPGDEPSPMNRVQRSYPYSTAGEIPHLLRALECLCDEPAKPPAAITTVPFPADAASCIMHALLLRATGILRMPPCPERKRQADRTWRQVKAYMEEECRHPISRRDVAKAAGISSDYLTHLLSKAGREGFSRYLTRMRMERARQLLANPQLRIKEIAADCGYRDEGYFIKVFRRFTGTTPAAYRASLPMG